MNYMDFTENPNPETCSLQGCDKPVYRKNCVCVKHFRQKERYGKFKERTMKDKNEIICDEKTCRIILTTPYGEPRAEAIIDREDREMVEKHRWSLVHGYARNRTVGFLHNYVLNFTPNKTWEVDHINNKKNDCRKINLRTGTHSQNCQNAGTRKNNSSGAKGVHFYKSSGLWCSRIGFQNKRIHLGYFKDKLEAVEKYNKSAIRLHGEYAQLNKIQGEQRC